MKKIQKRTTLNSPPPSSCHANLLTVADSYLLRPREPVRPATPGGEGTAATILIAPLSPGIVAAHCVKLTASLSARFHSVGRGTAEQTTHTYTPRLENTPHSLSCQAGPQTPHKWPKTGPWLDVGASFNDLKGRPCRFRE